MQRIGGKRDGLGESGRGEGEKLKMRSAAGAIKTLLVQEQQDMEEAVAK